MDSHKTVREERKQRLMNYKKGSQIFMIFFFGQKNRLVSFLFMHDCEANPDYVCGISLIVVNEKENDSLKVKIKKRKALS